jgi:predicted GH43/DUF377 family glycosyl hydrolase
LAALRFCSVVAGRLLELSVQASPRLIGPAESLLYGPGAVPIRTSEGWLNIFHGVRTMCKAHYVYSLGVCLHDVADPSRIIARYDDAILAPEAPYELTGQTPSVVSTRGTVAEDDGEVKLYYGGADAVMCLATTTVQRLLDACHSRPLQATRKLPAVEPACHGLESVAS